MSIRTVAGVLVVLLLGLAHPVAPAAAISDGESAGPYSWSVAFVYKKKGLHSFDNVYQRQFCSGALIKKKVVLTAAHCVDSIREAGRGNVTVVIGRKTLASGGGETREVASTKTPNNWDGTGDYLAFDVGLVRLSKSSTKTDIHLANDQVIGEWGVSGKARAYGYGATSGRNSNWGVGSDLHRAHYYYGLDQNHLTICGRSERGKVNNGDSGGPLIVSTTRGPRVIGVTSGEGLCGSGNEYFAKVGYRGSSSNSRLFNWVVANV